MGNTFDGMDWENVAQTGLDAFADALVPLQAFTLDLSAEATQGSVVSTRIVPVAGSVGDLTDDHTGAYSDAVDDQTFTAVDITLGSEPVIGFGFTDKEYMQISNGILSDSVQRLIKTHAYAVANKILDTVFAAVDTTFTAGVSAVTAANFDSDDVVDARTDWVQNGGTMLSGPTLVLDADYYGALLKDNAIQDYGASGIDAIKSGNIPMCNGFKVLEAPSLSGVAANNTTGFVCTPECFAIAMRPVQTQAQDDFIHYQVMQDPVTGVVLTYSVVFERNYRKVNHYFEAHWGFADGVTTSLRRITSA